MGRILIRCGAAIIHNSMWIRDRLHLVLLLHQEHHHQLLLVLWIIVPLSRVRLRVPRSSDQRFFSTAAWSGACFRLCTWWWKSTESIALWRICAYGVFLKHAFDAVIFNLLLRWGWWILRFDPANRSIIGSGRWVVPAFFVRSLGSLGLLHVLLVGWLTLRLASIVWISLCQSASCRSPWKHSIALGSRQNFLK